LADLGVLAMYNGIGLTTPRGSGTNGYVQRNWAAVRVSKDKVTICTDKDIEAFEASSNKQPNLEILEHERKRKIEVKCMELEDTLEEQGFTPSEIETKVQSFRELLMETGAARAELKRDEFGREIAKDTHEVADAQQRKNRLLKEAFGISDDYVTAQAFNTDRDEAAKNNVAKKEAIKPKMLALKAPSDSPPRGRRYALVRTPSPEPNSSSKRDKKEKEKEKEKSKKRKHKSRDRSRERDRSSSPKREKDKKKSKKHKKDRHRSRSR
jgi:serine/arginine repetitive matrix protein 2